MAAAHDPRLRASDADRDRVAEVLRRALTDGRLTVEEFDARLDACFAARTFGDLDAVVDDLPAPSPYDDLPVPASHTAGGSPALPDRLPASGEHHALGSYLAANLVCW